MFVGWLEEAQMGAMKQESIQSTGKFNLISWFSPSPHLMVWLLPFTVVPALNLLQVAAMVWHSGRHRGSVPSVRHSRRPHRALTCTRASAVTAPGSGVFLEFTILPGKNSIWPKPQRSQCSSAFVQVEDNAGQYNFRMPMKHVTCVCVVGGVVGVCCYFCLLESKFWVREIWCLKVTSALTLASVPHGVPY